MLLLNFLMQLEVAGTDIYIATQNESLFLSLEVTADQQYFELSVTGAILKNDVLIKSK